MHTNRHFSVRPATEADVTPVVTLFGEVAAEGRWIGTEPGFDADERAQRMTDTVSRGPGIMLVADAGGDVIGSLSLIPAAYGTADLGMLVAQEWRGKGVGRALLEAGIEWARAEPAVHKIALQHWPHNRAAHRLYLALGFLVEGRLRRHYRRSHGEVWDAIVMGLVVDDSAPPSSIPDDLDDLDDPDVNRGRD